MVMILLFTLIGFVVGTIGSVVGAGGGFLIVPLLLLVFHVEPAAAAGTSLVAVTVTAVVATITFARQGKVDWYGGLFLTATGYPGSLLGAWVGARVHPDQFFTIFGSVLALLAIWMIYKTLHRTEKNPSPGMATEKADEGETAAAADPEDSGEGAARNGMRLCRRLAETYGPVHTYCFVMPLAALLSFGIAFLGGMLGIGGGPILVPAMIYALGYPVHIATATSPFIIAFTAVGAAAMHIHGGHVLMDRAIALSLGSAAGATTGAWLSRRLKGNQIVYLLSAVLLLLGIRLVTAGLSVH